MAEDTETAESTESTDAVSTDTTVKSSDTDWKQQLSAEYRNHESMKVINTMDDLAKTYINSQKMIGVDKVVLPGDDATQEQLDAFYARIGRPDKPQDYNLKTTDKLPEGVTVDQGVIDKFAQTAHEEGLTTKQASRILGFYETLTADAVESESKSQQEKNTESEAVLRKEFGTAYDQKVGLAKQAIAQLAEGDQGMIETMNKTGMGSDPGFVKMMVKVGQMLGEDRLVGVGQVKPGRTPEEAREELNRLQADSGFMKQYFTSADPAHKDAVAKMRQLNIEAAGVDNVTIESRGSSIVSD